MYYKIKDSQNLVRDTNSMAVINTDVDAYNAFMKKRKQEQEQLEMAQKISKLENDISDIKNMLMSLATNK